MTLATLTRLVALSSALILLGVGAAMAGHHHEEEDVWHDCALCAAGSLSPLVDARLASSLCPAAARPVPPGPHGPPLRTLYRAHLLSRAPPAVV